MQACSCSTGLLNDPDLICINDWYRSCCAVFACLSLIGDCSVVSAVSRLVLEALWCLAWERNVLVWSRSVAHADFCHAAWRKRVFMCVCSNTRQFYTPQCRSVLWLAVFIAFRSTPETVAGRLLLKCGRCRKCQLSARRFLFLIRCVRNTYMYSQILSNRSCYIAAASAMFFFSALVIRQLTIFICVRY